MSAPEDAPSPAFTTPVLESTARFGEPGREWTSQEEDDARTPRAATRNGSSRRESGDEGPSPGIPPFTSGFGGELHAPQPGEPTTSMTAMANGEQPSGSNLEPYPYAQDGHEVDYELPPPTPRSFSFTAKHGLADLAAMYQPDEPTTLTVADGNGYFQDIQLATPLAGSFSFGSGPDGEVDAWRDRVSSSSGWKGKNVWRHDSVDSSETPRLSEGKGRFANTNGSKKGHRRTETASSVGSARSGAHPAPFHSNQSDAEDDDGGLPDANHKSSLERRRPQSQPLHHRQASTSSSSVAESVGTAADGTDSEYEEARIASRAPSRAASRRPSLNGSGTGGAKRLSSFAPIPSLNMNGSSTNLSAAAASEERNGHAVPGSRRTSTQQHLDAPSPTNPSQNDASRSDSPRSLDEQSRSHMSSGATSSSDRLSPPNSHSSATSAASSPWADATSPTNTKPVQHIESAASMASTRTKLPKSRPTILDRVMNKTRPRDLPPKEKAEENKHLKEYASMLVASKAAEKKRLEQNNIRRKEKEVIANGFLPSWENEILKNWKSVLRDDRLRNVWWSGSMPPRYRARLWQGCIGNGLALGKGSYAKALALAKSLSQQGQFLNEVIDAIAADIE